MKALVIAFVLLILALAALFFWQRHTLQSIPMDDAHRGFGSEPHYSYNLEPKY